MKWCVVSDAFVAIHVIPIQIAIMGQSGAGKTTLLNTLAQRVGGKLVGEVRVNGKLATKNVLKKNVGYVHQHVS